MAETQTILNQQDTTMASTVGERAAVPRSRKVVGGILILVMIGLIVFAFTLEHQSYTTLSRSMSLALNANENAMSNYRVYVGKYKETKMELDETTRKLVQVNQQLNQVSAQLEATKGMLAQTQGMLASAQQENTSLRQQLQEMDSLRTNENVQNVTELQAKMKSLRERDTQISSQLEELKGQLRIFEADFSKPEEGKSLIVLFQNKINLVKSRMNYLRQEAFLARIAAQKEKDRLALLNGNNGFMVHDGKLQAPDGNKKSFAIDVKIVQ